ncbi:folate-binding protein YgfZ [Candidatus Pseudothioglobus sp. Uisw_041]|jgi:folate-binding protein YgfZ|uniref:CAF17-like 4Fe-4S cluster assembly/insertion protein YgfZ n=1 Tax=Candidatus Pseudothioglobus sp. Uisw_041 TaxID=3230996 RepID=UPI003A841C9A
MFVHLKNRALLKVSGLDAQNFLQGQLSNDITKLNNSSVQLSAYCQHQGKILALFWVMRLEDSFLLSFPSDLLEAIKPRLQMFVIMSDVSIEDATKDYIQVGSIGQTHQKSLVINDKLSLIITDKKDINKFNMEPIEHWDMACVDSSLPEIFSITSEKLVPQMLNLDIDEFGVNFSKGCYPGQEVVARLHYLGSAKRRLFAFVLDSDVNVGDSLYCASSKSAKARGARYKSSGIVIFRIKYNSKFYCLATLEVELKDEAVTLNNEHGPTLTRIQK